MLLFLVIFSEKSLNYLLGRQSFSMHKHQPLAKPMMVCATDGTIVEVMGPYVGTVNDASIINNDLSHGPSPNEPIDSGSDEEISFPKCKKRRTETDDQQKAAPNNNTESQANGPSTSTEDNAQHGENNREYTEEEDEEFRRLVKDILDRAMKDDSSRILAWMKLLDVLILDRGFRDCIELLKVTKHLLSFRRPHPTGS